MKKSCKPGCLGRLQQRGVEKCGHSILALAVLLALVLILREWQNQRFSGNCSTALLVKHGIDAIPDEHPLAEAIKDYCREREEWPPKELGAQKSSSATRYGKVSRAGHGRDESHARERKAE